MNKVGVIPTTLLQKHRIARETPLPYLITKKITVQLCKMTL